MKNIALVAFATSAVVFATAEAPKTNAADQKPAVAANTTDKPAADQKTASDKQAPVAANAAEKKDDAAQPAATPAVAANATDKKEEPKKA